MSQDNQRLSKNERREAARAQAKAAREAQQKKEKRNRLFLQGGIVLGVLAVIAIVALVVTQMVKPAGPGPENMASGGVVFEGENLSVATTPAIEDGEQLIAHEVNRDEAPLDLVIYVDYLCPHCGTFEQQAGPMLEQWVGSGQATVEVYPMNIQDNNSRGTRYSTRAANAFACVAQESPDAAWDYHSLLLSADVQPAQGSTGLTNDQLISYAMEAGADDTVALRQCINNVTFSDFITKSTRQALSGPVIGLNEAAQEAGQVLTGTPTVMLNGEFVDASPATLEQQMLVLFGELSGESTGEDADSEDADAEETE